MNKVELSNRDGHIYVTMRKEEFLKLATGYTKACELFYQDHLAAERAKEEERARVEAEIERLTCLLDKLEGK